MLPIWGFSTLHFLSGIEPKSYENKIKHSWIWSDLKSVRNCKPSFHTALGLYGGVAYSGFSCLIGGREPWTFSHGGMYNFSMNILQK